MTTPTRPTSLAPLPQSITSAIFQPAPSRPPLSGPQVGRDPSKLPASCKPQEGPGQPLVWMVPPNQITSDNRLLELQDCWERI